MAAKTNTVRDNKTTLDEKHHYHNPSPSAGLGVIGLLAKRKTVTITMVPDWNNETRSPGIMQIVLGPANSTPETALWIFAMNVFSMNQLTGPSKRPDEEAISTRALLWLSGKYNRAVVYEWCKLANDDLKTHSITFHPYSEEKDPNTLIYVHRRPIGYFKIVEGSRYSMNLTFEAGSNIAQMVALQCWRPNIFFTTGTKKPVATRQFTNFVTNWAQEVERDPNHSEQKAAMLQDQKDERVSVRQFGLPPYPHPPPAPPVTILKPTFFIDDQPTARQYFDLVRELNRTPPTIVSLPSVDLAAPTPFSLDVYVEQFVTSPLAKALFAFELVAQKIASDPSHSSYQAACQFMTFTMAINQMTGWQHVSEFISDSEFYMERTKRAHRDFVPMQMLKPLGTPQPGSLPDFQLRGQVLMKRIALRMDWLLTLNRLSDTKFDAEFALSVHRNDHVWATDAANFIKEAEDTVTAMLLRNRESFEHFRAFQRKGVQWPHHPKLRHLIEDAKFSFRPMMIKRDRCICEGCGREVNGWRPWHNPWNFHDYSRHPPTFGPPAQSPEPANDTKIDDAGKTKIPHSADDNKTDDDVDKMTMKSAAKALSSSYRLGCIYSLLTRLCVSR